MVPKKPNKVLKTQVVFCVFLTCWHTSLSQTYENAKAVVTDKLASTAYLNDVRPTNDQSVPMTVDVSFELISIVSIDDVSQKFVCNGFLTAVWVDERVTWDPANYGGVVRMFPDLKKMWRPRMVIFNTLEARDLFEDDHAPLNVMYNGTVFWAPGSLFPTSCELDMRKFPFDEQTCTIQVICMNYDATEIQIVSSVNVGTKFYVPNGEWDLLETKVTATSLQFDQNPTAIPAAIISFQVKRRPVSFLLNIILPVVFLSLLNILVFLIPVDSGEKISYGITVLLALAVFLSIVSSMLPSSASSVPFVTIYLFCLLVISVLTVVASIIIVFLHNLEEKEDRCMKATDNFQTAFTKVKGMNKVRPMSSISAVAAMMKKRQEEERKNNNNLRNGLRSELSQDSLQASEDDAEIGTKDEGQGCKDKPKPNKYRLIGKYIDMVSLLVFSIAWTCLTLGFLIKITT